MATLASATGWPFSSTTFPLTIPWANAGAENTSATASARTPRYRWVRMLKSSLFTDDPPSRQRRDGATGLTGNPTRKLRSLTEELFHRCQLLRNRCRRERNQESAAISHRPQAGVEDGQNAAVGTVADEPA